MRIRDESGQLLVGVIVMMVVLAVIIPAMVLFVKNEIHWSIKQERNMTAFQLAEAAIDRGYSMVTNSTRTWELVQMGGSNIPTSFLFNAAYVDVSSGTYALSVSSGPDEDQVTIIGVGRDFYRKEVRAIKAVYTNLPLGDIAIMGGTGVAYTGNNIDVEWGAVVSPESITTANKNHPTFWSAGSVDIDTNSATPPNCDSPNCHFWHSYYAGIPPMPDIGFKEYELIAQATPDGPCGAYYTAGDKSLNCTDTSGNTYYITGNVTDIQGHITGNIIVLGNFNTGNGNLFGTSQSVELPRVAWKQYSNDWGAYLSAWDPTKPAVFPGATSSYKSPAGQMVTLSPVINGFVYVGGNFSGPQGGGNIDFVYGVIYVRGTVTLDGNSHVTIYYGDDAAQSVKTTNIVLKRESWQDWPRQGWPSGL